MTNGRVISKKAIRSFIYRYLDSKKQEITGLYSSQIAC